MRRVLVSLPTALTLRTPDCMEWEGSQMGVIKCWIDVANNDLWIHILHDATAPYTESTLSIVVRTVNYAVLNPNVLGAQTYSVPIKMYNWTTTYDFPEGVTLSRNSV